MSDGTREDGFPGLTLGRVGGYVPSFISRPRHNRSIVSLRSLADVSGTVIPSVRMGAQVRDISSCLYCLVAHMLCGAGVVHAVTYSLLLLNTDLHVADITTRMSRNQFVRNTMTAIQMQLHPQRYASTMDLDLDDASSGPTTNSEGTETQSMTRSKRSGSIASWNSISKDTFVSSGALSSAALSAVQPSLNSSTTSFHHSPGVESKSLSTGPLQLVYDRTWETEMEGLLKVCL